MVKLRAPMEISSPTPQTKNCAMRPDGTCDGGDDLAAMPDSGGDSYVLTRQMAPTAVIQPICHGPSRQRFEKLQILISKLILKWKLKGLGGGRESNGIFDRNRYK